MDNRKRVHVIGCGVLAIDIKHVAERLEMEIGTTFLKGGLHNEPTKLRMELQEAIDEVSKEKRCDRIAIGYGVCGRGTIGVQAREVPLVMPKAHDCIALFLGSNRAYKKEFSRFPGTYYISAGWYEENVQPRSLRKRKVWIGDRGVSYEKLVEKYGREYAKEIMEFLNSWQKNYQRAVFIDTGAKKRNKYAEYAQAMANEFEWKYEKLTGNLLLLEKLLTAEETDDEVLIVPPGYFTEFNAVEGTLMAVPMLGLEGDQNEVHSRIRLMGKDEKEKRGTGRSIRYGLGIDAGGTYTDVVIYDFMTDMLMAKSKALTTKWDFTVGIKEALGGLDVDLLSKVELVAVSTTLATNAIVEGKGQKVGLLVMPPYGLFDPEEIPHEPKEVICGRLEIDGKETGPVDEEEVRRIARRMAEKNGVKAFAISGFAGAINPMHELQVKRIIRKETGLSVTCGHELSELLNFKTRAETAVLNAKIIPQLEKLLQELEEVLQAQAIMAPVVVVKGDGSLIASEVAKERPVETILSGPAASVAGARHLTNQDEAIVIDVGGTTTDTAALKQGLVRVCESGTTVGGFKTHVKALEMRTTGLGGDSLILWEGNDFFIGPQRVSPLAWLGTRTNGLKKALHYLEQRLDEYKVSSRPMQILTITGHADGLSLTTSEKEILHLLQERPHSLDELARKTDVGYWNLLSLGRLEEHHTVQRCGFTATDLLHVNGLFERWDKHTSMRMCGMLSQVTGYEDDKFMEYLLEEIVRKLSIEILKKQLDEETESDELERCGVCGALIKNLLDGGNEYYQVNIKFHRPLIGIGAPVHYFLPRAGEILGAETIVPEDADVANAIGAITSNVMVRRQVSIKIDDEGKYLIEGIEGAKSFETLKQANDWAIEELGQRILKMGQSAGTSRQEVEMEIDDSISSTAEGTPLFLGRTIVARLTGRPDLVTASSAPKS